MAREVKKLRTTTKKISRAFFRKVARVSSVFSLVKSGKRNLFES
ncbi:DUF1661 domain-containing protein [Porphyromonas gulae]|nr:DUF1661 domain-containing protein [Porphyromonas gulae]